MNAVARSFWQTLVLTLAGVSLLSGCHHGSSTSTPSYTVYVTVVGLAGSGLVLQNNGVDNLSVTANGQTNFTGTLQNGSTYDVTVLTEPSSPAQICSVFEGIGLVNGYNVVVEVSCGTVGTNLGRFAYASNGGDGTVSGYSIAAASGALTPVTGSPFIVPGAKALGQAQIDQTGSFLLVVDSGGNQVYGANINQQSGALTKISGYPVATGHQPVSLTFDYTGEYLYVANYADNTISAYTMDITTGALTALAGSPFTVPGNNPGPRQLVRAGSFLFCVNQNTSTVAVFSITAGTGVLTQNIPGSPFATDVGPHSLAVGASSGSTAVLYTANAGSSGAGSVSAFTVDLATGVLSPVSGSPLPIPVVNNVNVDSKAKYLFVTETGGVAVYPIVNVATGALNAPVSGSPFATGANPFSVVTDVDDLFVYVGNDGSASISQYTLDSGSGVLTPVAAAAQVAAGANPDYLQIQ